MSTRETLELIHELDSYGLINQAASDEELETALTELVMCDGGEDGD